MVESWNKLLWFSKNSITTQLAWLSETFFFSHSELLKHGIYCLHQFTVATLPLLKTSCILKFAKTIPDVPFSMHMYIMTPMLFISLTIIHYLMYMHVRNVHNDIIIINLQTSFIYITFVISLSKDAIENKVLYQDQAHLFWKFLCVILWWYISWLSAFMFDISKQ